MCGSKEFLKIRNQNEDNFDYCIIDEAGQCTETEVLVPLQLRIENLVLVGDPEQLSATVFLQGNEAKKYKRSLFERLIDGGISVHLLFKQYRMNQKISEFPSRFFYHNLLENGPNVYTPCFMRKFHNDQNLNPLLFFSINYSLQKQRMYSWFNNHEAV